MKRLLIVEDDEFLVDAYQTKLQREAIILDIARDGTEAIEKISSYKPDLIVLDLLMPRKDGFEVLRHMRDNGHTTPVIVASNLDTKEKIQEALDLGAKDFFVKSEISVSELVDKLKNHLE